MEKWRKTDGETQYSSVSLCFSSWLPQYYIATFQSSIYQRPKIPVECRIFKACKVTTPSITRSSSFFRYNPQQFGDNNDFNSIPSEMMMRELSTGDNIVVWSKLVIKMGWLTDSEKWQGRRSKAIILLRMQVDSLWDLHVQRNSHLRFFEQTMILKAASEANQRGWSSHHISC